ncbi:L,D-transpeptidase [Taklimakanibacter deserti]|jgi:lipoprotein-anchoring transpeptidase ErfK/SrfK|uniref:L,D-transpeptidase n=1 Tax=Taklimakanibacter deserti TaxID=2267839 RepID=UPI000E6522D9
MRKIWVGAAAVFAVVGLVTGGVQAATPNVKSNITVYSEKPAPKKKVVKTVKVVKVEQKKPQAKREYRRASLRRTCDSFFECLFSTRRATRASFGGMGGGDRTTRSTVSFSDGKYKPGSIIIRTPERALYYVLPGGKALRYKVGVGKEGFQWSGNSSIGMKREWPDWRPPAVMIAREAAKGNIIPEYMEGGPNNPLGARAMYISGTMFRIHGTNNAASIGGAVSSGCIRMMNSDVIDLYDRVALGSRVYVYQ